MRNEPMARIVFIFRLLLVTSFLLIIIQLGLIIFNADQQLRLVVNDILTPVGSLISSVILTYGAIQAKKQVPEYYNLWLFTALAVFLWFIGDVLWMILEVFLQQEPFPSVADVFYLFYYPVSLIGIFLLPAIHRKRTERIKISLDMTIVILSATLLFWSFLIGPILESTEGGMLEQIVSMAYPIFDLALLWGLIVLMVRPYRDRSYIPFVLLGISIALQIFSDVFYTIQTSNDTFTSGTMLDMGWQTAILLYGIAGQIFLHQMSRSHNEASIKSSKFYEFLLDRVWPFIPYIWVLAGYIMLVWSYETLLPISPRVLVIGVGVIIGLVMFRQYITFDENLHLSKRLQRELAERIEVDKALQESEVRYRAIVEDQTELICRYFPNGTISFVNEAYCRYFGKKREALIGSTFIPLVPQEDQQQIADYLAGLGKEKPIGSLEHRVILSNGAVRWQHWTDRVILNESGEIFEIASVGYDITEKKWSEDALNRRAREFGALYDMSMEINSQLDLSSLLHSVLWKAANLLDAPMGGLFLHIPDTDSVKMEAGYNMPAEMTGITMPVGSGCVGIVAKTGMPLMIEDYQNWTEKDPMNGFTGLRRVLSLPLRLGEEITGVLVIADNQKTGRFSEEEVRLVTLFADQAAIAVVNARLYDQAQSEIAQRKKIEELLTQTNEILEVRVTERTAQLVSANDRLNVELSERKRAEEKIRASLVEKEVLLKEIHHRVKNNLQVISSLLNMQFSRTQDPQTLEALAESQNRVRSMALIHEKIYQSQNLAEVDFSEYINSLASYLFRSYRASQGTIKMNIRVDSIGMGVDYAVPCGLILNELISNSLKHAFPSGQSGEISITLCRKEPNQIELVVADNGIGLPKSFDLYNTTSLGLQLINMLVTQLDGAVRAEADGGSKFIVLFPDYSSKVEAAPVGG